MRPLFSVLMSVYNHQDYVEQAIRSVMAQTFGEWELIVINDGSRDDSPGIIDRLGREDPRLVVVHQTNAGLAAARNTAAGRARAPWLTYLDSDDIWFPDALEHFAGALRERPQTQLLYGFAHRLRGSTITPLSGEYQDRATGTRELFGRVFLNPMCVCHRAALWRQAGGFDAALRYCDDYDFFLRLSLYCRFEPLHQPVGLRRRHEHNMSQKSGQSQQSEAGVLRRFADQFGAQAGLDRDVIDRRLGRLYVRAAQQYYREGDFAQALAMVQNAKAHCVSMKGRVLGWLSWLRLPLTRQAG